MHTVDYEYAIKKIQKYRAGLHSNISLFDISTILAVIYEKDKQTTLDDLLYTEEVSC